MNKWEFATWCGTLSDGRLAQVSELCWQAMLFTEEASLGNVRDAVRRALEDCWAARLADPLPHALALLRDEMRVLHEDKLGPFLQPDYIAAPTNGGEIALMRRGGGLAP